MVADIGPDIEVGSACEMFGDYLEFFLLVKAAMEVHLLDEVPLVLDKEQRLASLVAHPAYRAPGKPLKVASPR